MLDFKLNYYFEKMKDISFTSRQEFRIIFKKKYGKFQYLEELIKMIEEYQIKKYGCRIANYYELRTSEDAIRLTIKARQRERRRIGK